MKKILLFFILGTLGSFAQSYSTGTINFTAGYTGKIDTNATTVTLTLNGPSDRWFAIGFNTSTMSSGDCVYFNGTTLVDSKLIGYTTPSTDATQNWTVSSNTVSGSTRTIVATRSLNTGDTNDYVFSNSASSYSVVWAKGSTASFAISGHGGANRGATTANPVLANQSFEAALFKLSSNPVKDNFSIELPQEINEAKLFIYDANGKKVKEVVLSSNSQNMIEVNNLNPGLHILNVQSATGNYTKKIIIE